MRKKKSQQNQNAITEWYIFSLNPISSNINWNDQTCSIKNPILLIQFNFYLSYHLTYQTDFKELSLDRIQQIWKDKQNTLFKKWKIDAIDQNRYLVLPFYVSGQNHWYIGVFILCDNQTNPVSKEVKKKITRLADKPSNLLTNNFLVNLPNENNEYYKKSNNEIRNNTSSTFNLLDNIINLEYYQSKYIKLITSEVRSSNRHEEQKTEEENYLTISVADIWKNLRNVIPELRTIYSIKPSKSITEPTSLGATTE